MIQNYERTGNAIIAAFKLSITGYYNLSGPFIEIVKGYITNYNLQTH